MKLGRDCATLYNFYLKIENTLIKSSAYVGFNFRGAKWSLVLSDYLSVWREKSDVHIFF